MGTKDKDIFYNDFALWGKHGGGQLEYCGMMVHEATAYMVFTDHDVEITKDAPVQKKFYIIEAPTRFDEYGIKDISNIICAWYNEKYPKEQPPTNKDKEI